MPATVSVSKGTLIEETLGALYRSAERPAQLVVGANALTGDSDVAFTLSLGTLNVTDRVESATGELMLVTAKSSDSDPIYTVARAQAGEKEDVATGDVLLKNPVWGRAEVTGWIQKAIDGLMNAELPWIDTDSYNRHGVFGYVELPADSIDVVRVRHFNTLDGRISDVGGWAFEPDIPTSIISSGAALRVSTGVGSDDDLIVSVRRPYTWEGTGEDATVPLPVSGQDIPALYAAAFGLMRREVSRSELDKIEEWNQEQAIRAGVNLRMVREAWGEVYRRVDEAKETHRVPKVRRFRKIPKVW